MPPGELSPFNCRTIKCRLTAIAHNGLLTRDEVCHLRLPCFFSPLGILAGRPVWFAALISLFFNDRSETIISGCTKFSRIFFQKMILLFVDDQTGPLFSDSSADVAMATNCRQNWQNDLRSAGWSSKMDRSMAVFDSKIFNGNIVCKSATPEITRVTAAQFGRDLKNHHHHHYHRHFRHF